MARKSRPATVLSLMTLLSLWPPGLVRGEEIHFQVPKLDFQGEHTSFSRGDSLYIKIRNFDSSKYPNLRARLFWGTKKGIPDHYYRVIEKVGLSGDRCFIYDSRLLPLHATREGVNLGALPPSGNWVVVFEDGDWGNGAIKISEAAVGDYFKHGYEFSVEPPPEPRSPAFLGILAKVLHVSSGNEVGAAAPTSAKQDPSLNSIELAATNKVACVRFRNVKDATLIAEAGRCPGCQDPDSEKNLIVSWFINTGISFTH
jgi:hypothetical protein